MTAYPHQIATMAALERAQKNGMVYRFGEGWRAAWWTCRCSACVLQRQEKDDQYRDNAANGQL